MLSRNKIWFWNQGYFEGLKEIGEAYKERVDFEHFSAYCLLKERGLKKLANAEALTFAKLAAELPVSRKREIAADLAEVSVLQPRVHSLINHPIQIFISETLKAWIEDDPKNLTANRFYAFYGGGQEALEAALTIKSDDQISLVRLSYWLLGDVDYMVHHLDEGCFLGDESDAQNILKRVGDFITQVEDKQTQGYLSEEHKSYESMLKIWISYKQSKRSKSFPQWAPEKGFEFRFPAKFYYDA